MPAMAPVASPVARSELAREKPKDAPCIQDTSVIVGVLREQVRSYKKLDPRSTIKCVIELRLTNHDSQKVYDALADAPELTECPRRASCGGLMPELENLINQ